jgi:hypothetical protein
MLLFNRVALQTVIRRGRIMQVDQTAEQAAAIAAAETWLALVDAGDSAQSWNQASSRSKSGIQTRWLNISGGSEQQWQSGLADIQIQFGRAVSRNLKSKQYAEHLPYEPEGKYVVLKYETSFERYNGVETVTLLKENDGAWRVSSYKVVLGWVSILLNGSASRY